MRIMIGYDGSDCARDAILELHRAGLPDDTSATVVTLADVSPRFAAGPPESAGDATGWENAPIVRKARALTEQSIAESHELAAKGAALVKAEFPGWTVSHAAYAGSPYGALIEPADGPPDLIVVGSHGRSALGRLAMGSVSQNVLAHAPCSVRISRRPPTDAPPRGSAVRIVIGIDGSHHSALAVAAVADRVWPAGTQVKVIVALDLKLMAALAGPSAAPWMKLAPGKGDAFEWAREVTTAVADELRSSGLEVIPVVEEADPKRLLPAEAERWSADCIFVGAKGQAAIERFLLGSVSAAVASRAPCSVEVVRHR